MDVYTYVFLNNCSEINFNPIRELKNENRVI